jgi:hypothetical protein
MKSKISKIDAKHQPVRVGMGIFGYVILDELGDALKQIVQPHSTYRDGSHQDQELAVEMGFPYLTSDDLAGYYYTGQALISLLEAGVGLTYLDQPVTSLNDIGLINERRDQLAWRELNEAKKARDNPDN